MSATEQDRTDFKQMLADGLEIGRLAHALEQRHLTDISALMISAVTRLDGLLEAVQLELRLIEHYLSSTR